MSSTVVIKPVLTEKATQMAKRNIYTFRVATCANKHQIASVIESMFKVKVSGIRTIMRQGKTRRTGRTAQTKQLPENKIAFITVTQGKIDIFPQS